MLKIEKASLQEQLVRSNHDLERARSMAASPMKAARDDAELSSLRKELAVAKAGQDGVAQVR